MVVSLLFLGLAFFAVGQAGATRNGTQSAADAAALAAAKESRDLLDLGDLDSEGLADLFAGELAGKDGCEASHTYAARNGATVQGCAGLGDGRWGFRVTVKSQKPVGDTVLPGTEGDHAVATATAIVVPRCVFEPVDEPPGEPVEEPTGEPTEGPAEGPAEDEAPPLLGSLNCEGSVLDLDPRDLPDTADLFEVRLVED
ncbi:pilus assembly protein TadG-related protein [Streptomyces sudanensis]|nr:pilus assembly protein TadG-related protein [Streptomyces sudanensis]